MAILCLSGGELAAALVVDVPWPGFCPACWVMRLRAERKFQRVRIWMGLLDCPQYTRPAEFRGWKVPDVLLGGNHEEIKRWRRARFARENRTVASRSCC